MQSTQDPQSSRCAHDATSCQQSSCCNCVRQGTIKMSKFKAVQAVGISMRAGQTAKLEDLSNTVPTCANVVTRRARKELSSASERAHSKQLRPAEHSFLLPSQSHNLLNTHLPANDARPTAKQNSQTEPGRSGYILLTLGKNQHSHFQHSKD